MQYFLCNANMGKISELSDFLVGEGLQVDPSNKSGFARVYDKNSWKCETPHIIVSVYNDRFPISIDIRSEDAKYKSFIGWIMRIMETTGVVDACSIPVDYEQFR